MGHDRDVASVTRLALIRHGESGAQVAGLVSGHDSCLGLSETGADQARRLAERLARTGELAEVNVVYTSLLRRAQETAGAIGASMGSPQVLQDCRWCEIHPGTAEGMTWEEMRVRFPPEGDPDDPVARRLPEMETWEEMYERVGNGLHEVTRTHKGGTIVVVTSGGPIGASFVTLGGASYRDGILHTRETKNTSITEWYHDGRAWTLERHNDTAHLDDG
jgi:probable phosphoglycerate mutase